MQLPSPKKLLPENFPELSWFPRLAAIINPFFADVIRAFNKGLTIRDNFDGMTKEVIIDGTYPITFKWDRNSKPTLAFIAGIRRVDGASFTLTNAIFLQWSFTQNGSISIDAIPGLAASATDKFNITIIALVG